VSDADQDEDQPTKPMMSEDHHSEFNLPLLADKHKNVLNNKKGSVVITSNQKFLNENDSQNSNSQGDLLKAAVAP